ncbi:MAG: succinyl-CoA synthetase alpha subunit, partial [Thermoleophilaceae bacterium]|nr:succinyl-CoA synthetase alpha subunit [Thermoleophilaceae bacterium]
PRRPASSTIWATSKRGIRSVTITISLMPASIASNTASFVNAGGTVTTEPSGTLPISLQSCATESNTGTPCTSRPFRPGVAKMGGIGGPARDAEKAYKPGSIGVMSRSGGMTTEISSTLSAAGLGVSTAVSIGGDAIIGSTYAELMPLFEADEQTEGIVIYTEPGGRMEAELARWVTENESRLPIVAFMAGRFMDEMPGMSFGHAGTIVEGKADTAAEKIKRLADAGITVAEEISEIPDLIREKIGKVAA